MSVSSILPVNHTPHAIVVVACGDDNDRILHTFPPVEPVIRLVEAQARHTEPVVTPDGIVIPTCAPPTYCGLSHSVSGSILVSAVVAQSLVENIGMMEHLRITAIYAPDTGPSGAVRDANGAIVGTKRLVKYL